MIKRHLLIALLISTAMNAWAVSPFDYIFGDTKEEVADADNIDSLLQSDMFSTTSQDGSNMNGAEIIVLDKRLGKPSSTISLKVGKPAAYKDLQLELKKCWQADNDEWEKDARALIAVSANKEEATESWFFSKIPGLSPLQPKRFEIFVRRCVAE